MRRFMTSLTVLFLLCSCSQGPSDPRIEERIHRVENGLIEVDSPEDLSRPDGERLANPRTLPERMEHHKTPGVSIAVVNDGRVEWARAYGVADANTGTPVTTDTIFEAASTSKFVTAVMALHFVEQGLLELDTDVNRYLRSWQVPENEYTRVEKVTLRRLLTHQAGIPSTNYAHDESMGYPTLLDVLNGRAPALNKPAAPEFVPGSRWQYSNVAYNVIQLLLEDVTGKPFQQIAEEVVFGPLDMRSSTFVYPLGPESAKREAMPHDAEGVSREPAMHLTALAHGGLTTTPTELATFLNELLLSYQGKSEKIISREMTRRMFTRECDIDREKFPLPIEEGLGVFLTGQGQDRAILHPGSNYPGLNCWLIGWPERGTGAVVMSNGGGFGFLGPEIAHAIDNEYNRARGGP